MTINGNGTTINNNRIDGDSGHYGLNAYRTTETISKNNGGGGNYGGDGTIKYN